MRPQRIHPLPLRIAHWVNAAAMVIMITSGWRVYNASPFFPIEIPLFLTLGSWLGGALAWHFAAMWLLVLNFLVYLGYGLTTGHLRRRLLPLTARTVTTDFVRALRFQLPHDDHRYNAVQRLFYLGVIALIILVIASGLALWKPVQLASLGALFGGYEGTRRVHFLAMAGIVGFITVHVALVVIVPRTLLAMIIGRAPRQGGVS